MYAALFKEGFSASQHIVNCRISARHDGEPGNRRDGVETGSEGRTERERESGPPADQGTKR